MTEPTGRVETGPEAWGDRHLTAQPPVPPGGWVPRVLCAGRQGGGTTPHAHGSPQTAPRAGHSTIIAPTERARNPAITSPHTRRLPPRRPGASLSSPPSPKASGQSAQELALLAPGWALAGRRGFLIEHILDKQHRPGNTAHGQTAGRKQGPTPRSQPPGACVRGLPRRLGGGWGQTSSR